MRLETLFSKILGTRVGILTPVNKKSFVSITVLLMVMLLVAMVPAQAAVVTWDGGGGTNNWSEGANWSTGTVPTSDDVATFDGTSTNDVTINVDINVAGIDINTNYTGAITQAADKTITLGSSGYDQATGTFTGGNSDITINGPFVLSGGTFTATSGTINAKNDWTVSGGTFNHNSGTVVFYASVDHALTITGSHTLYNLKFQDSTSPDWNNSDTFTIASGTTLTVTGTLTLIDYAEYRKRGVIDGAGTISAKGDITIIDGGCMGTTIVNIDGTGNQTFTGTGSSGGGVPAVNINKPSGTLTLVSTITATDNWTHTSGTIDAGTSTVVFYGVTDEFVTISGSHTLYNVKFQDSTYRDWNNSDTFTIASGTTLTVTGTLTLIDYAEYRKRGVIDGAGTISAKGDITIIDGGCMGTTIVNIDGTGNQTFTGTGSSGGGVPAVNINKPSGTLTLVSTITATDNWTHTSGTIDAGTSTVVFYGVTDEFVTISGSHTLYNVKFQDSTYRDWNNSDTFTIASGTTLTVTGTLTLIDYAEYRKRGVIDGAGTISAKGDITIIDGGCTGTTTINIDGDGNQTFTGTAAIGGCFPAVNINKSGGTLTLVSTISASDDWTYTSGTIDAGTSTVIFWGYTDDTVTITGSHTLANVTFRDSKGEVWDKWDIFTIASGTILTITGTFTTSDPNGHARGVINGPGTISARGNLTTDERGFEGNVAISLTGSDDQTITASGLFSTGTFTVNKSGGTVTLAANFTLTGTLTLTSGNISTGADTLTLGTSSEATLSHTSGTIVGNFSRYIAASTGSRLFPVGTSSYYRPLTIVYTAAPTSAGTITVSHTSPGGNYANLSPTLDDGGYTLDRRSTMYWTTSASSISGGTYTLNVNANGQPGIIDPTKLRVIHSTDGTNFNLVGAHSAGSGTTAKRTGIDGSTFGQFYIAANSGDNSLPVELSIFTVQLIENTPILNWVTQSETNNSGWNVYRGETNEALSNEEAYLLNISLGLIPGAGTTSEPTDYSFEDVFPIVEGNTYFYWLESVDYSGETELYGPISLSIPEYEWQNPNSPEIPKPYGLHQNYPNPFNPSTEISFMLNENCIGDLSIHNLKGQKIKTLFKNRPISRDKLVITTWDGKDKFGKNVSSGIYLYELKTNKEIYLKRMLLIK